MTDDGEKPDPADAFFLPDEGDADPRPIIRRLVLEQQIEAFRHLRMGDAVILVVMRRERKRQGGKVVLGEMALPRFQGPLAGFGMWLLAKSGGGALPDFIMILDAEFWASATTKQREALAFHELMHADHAQDRYGEPRFTDTGLPIWAIRDHDIAEFNEVVARYGAYLPDVREFAGALRDGGVV